MAPSPPRLTSLAHGGGCGCKLSPAVLRDILSAMPRGAGFPSLLVGHEAADDAAVWQVDANTCVISTTDFFTPVVDDPRAFGRIAATNAISDVYAMGGRPVFALAILGMPLGKLAPEVVREILAGGAEACAQAGIPVAGGHSVDVAEPIYGLAVTGLAHPARIRRNGGARPGDALVLTKPLGVGVYSAVLKSAGLGPAEEREMLRWTTLLNRAGEGLSALEAVHAMTDVTGFGILGHGLEMARASALRLVLDADALPLLSRAAEWARAGHVTGASRRNWESYGAEVTLPAALPDWRRALLTDPQTSGGLLVACAPEAVDAVLAIARETGCAEAAVVGRAEDGPPGVTVVAPGHGRGGGREWESNPPGTG